MYIPIIIITIFILNLIITVQCVIKEYTTAKSEKNLTYCDVNSVQLKFTISKTNVLDRLTNISYTCDTLDLSNTGIRFIIHTAFNSLTIENLNLTNNNIQELNGETFSTNYELINLWMSNNALYFKLEQEDLFYKLNKLQQLRLSHNMIAFIPDKLFRNQTLLKELYLDNNLINKITEKLFKNTGNLTHLYLNNNVLVYLHENCFDYLKNLEELHLEFNDLHSISKNLFNKTVNLIKLYLQDNHIGRLENYAFEYLKRLEILTGNNNNISKIFMYAFTNLTSLKELHLDNNTITELKHEIFQDNKNLISLSLNNNYLKMIEENVFDDLRHLNYLNISSNNLTTLPNISNIMQFREFYFFDNPWTCDCLLYYLFKRWEKNSDKQNVKCLKPEIVSWKDLSLENFICKQPIFKIHPHPTHILREGETLNIICQVTANPLTEYPKWFLENGQEVVIGTTFERYGNTTKQNRLIIQNVTFSDTGVYICQIDEYTEAVKVDIFENDKPPNMNAIGWYIIIGLFLIISLLVLFFVKYVFLKILADENAINYGNAELISMGYSDHQKLSKICNYNSLTSGQFHKYLKQTKFKITYKTKEDIKKIETCTTLNLDNKQIEDWTTNLFSLFPSLKILSLSNNNIKHMKEGFYNLTEAEELRLSNNQINKIDENVFTSMTKLKTLYLDNNSISILNTTFDGLKTLEFLYLNNNIIEILSEKIMLKNLKELHLQNNSISRIKNKSFKPLTKLKYLNLASNKLKHITNSSEKNINIFSNLKNLEILLLNENKIEFGQMPLILTGHLKFLDLSGNMIYSLKNNAFSNPMELEIINLSNNDLKEIQDLFFNRLQYLKTLILNNNRITLRDNIFKNSGLRYCTLEHLEIQFNNLNNINNIIFKRLCTLVVLNMAHNHILKIENNSFDNLISLEKCHLEYNRISNLPPDLFNNTTNLKHLNLQHNHIQFIPKNFLAKLTKLQHLNLQHNFLTFLDMSVFSGSNILQFLHLEGNPWTCDCFLQDVFNIWLKTFRNDNTYCVEPQKYFKKSWRQIDKFQCVPTVEILEQNTVTEGENITLFCFVTANPNAHIAWMENNNILINMTADTVNIWLNYSIVNASKSDEKLYTCSAVNSLGEGSREINLVVLKKETNVDKNSTKTKLFLIFIIIAPIMSILLMICKCITLFINMRKKTETNDIPLEEFVKETATM